MSEPAEVLVEWWDAFKGGSPSLKLRNRMLSVLTKGQRNLLQAVFRKGHKTKEDMIAALSPVISKMLHELIEREAARVGAQSIAEAEDKRILEELSAADAKSRG